MVGTSQVVLSNLLLLRGFGWTNIITLYLYRIKFSIRSVNDSENKVSSPPRIWLDKAYFWLDIVHWLVVQMLGDRGSIKALGNSRGQKGMSQNIKFLERQVNDATITKKEQTHVIDHLKLCPVQWKKKEWQGEYQPSHSQLHSSHISLSLGEIINIICFTFKSINLTLPLRLFLYS